VKISGADTLPFPVAEVWEAILDPKVLVATIPGCERLETTGENCYAMTVTAGVAAIKGTYAGSCTLSDLAPRRSLVMRVQGAGAPGTVDATVDVHFDEVDGGTRVSYDAEAVVGGMVGGVGQRMLTSVSHRMVREFFGNVGSALAGGPAVAEARAVVASAPGAAPLGTEARPGVFTPPARPSGVSAEDDFVKGVVLGAALVLAGVVVGGIFGRRR
jgi:carbon monoxide dehydrogenase subunit G